MANVWTAIWSEVKRAARQAPKLYAAPFLGAYRETRGVMKEMERENKTPMKPLRKKSEV